MHQLVAQQIVNAVENAKIMVLVNAGQIAHVRFSMESKMHKPHLLYNNNSSKRVRCQHSIDEYYQLVEPYKYIISPRNCRYRLIKERDVL